MNIGGDFIELSKSKTSKTDKKSFLESKFLPGANVVLTKVKIDNEEKIMISAVEGVGSLPEELQSDKHYVHNQTVLSNIWTIYHNLNKVPNITIKEQDTNMTIIGAIEIADLNVCRVYFNRYLRGTAYCN